MRDKRTENEGDEGAPFTKNMSGGRPEDGIPTVMILPTFGNTSDVGMSNDVASASQLGNARSSFPS